MRSPAPPLPVLLGLALLVVVALANSAEIRERAADGLGRGMPAREAALARGFVLGEDEEIDERTEEDFRRAGLSHLLAVSGQNVTLLALLAMPLLGAFGIPLRERLVWVLALIAVYVPVAGAGPSIQRAGVMGALGLLATLSGRRSSRFYALALAAMVTLAIDPGIAADVGWQLSFAAVLGILLLAAPLRGRIVARFGRGPWRQALAEGVAMTVAATLATAPLIAFHFETVSTTTLVANVLALPAVAPAMWLGMCGAGLAQLPGLPLEPLNGLNALLLAYVAQVAAWCATPEWAELQVHLSAAGLIAVYLGLALGVLVSGGGPGRSSRWSPPVSWDGFRSPSAALQLNRCGGCGSRCLMSARATRSCSSRRVPRQSSSTAVRRAMDWSRSSRTRASTGWGSDRHPRPVRPRRRDRRAARKAPVERLLFARVDRGLIAEATAAGADARADRGGAGAALGGAAPAGPVAAPGAARDAELWDRIRTSWRW